MDVKGLQFLADKQKIRLIVFAQGLKNGLKALVGKVHGRDNDSTWEQEHEQRAAHSKYKKKHS